MGKRTEESMEELAETVVDSLDMGDLLSYAKDSMIAQYRNNPASFHDDWVAFMEEDKPKYGYTIEGELPEGYPEPIQYAWFPTTEFCEFCDVPSFEGYMTLYVALRRYSKEIAEFEDAGNVGVTLFEILPVADVEDCTIIVC